MKETIAGSAVLRLTNKGHVQIVDDLAVYKDGIDHDDRLDKSAPNTVNKALSFGVRPGRYFNGTSVVAYRTAEDGSSNGSSGATGSPNHTLTDNASNFIYLILATDLIGISTSAFPDQATTPHVPLAIITTKDGTYSADDIDDYRGAALWSAPGGGGSGGPPAAGSLAWAQLSPALKGIISPPAMILKLSATAAGWLALTVENGVWDESELTLTCTGAFTDYTYAEGDIIFIAGGAGVIPGGYVVASRDSANQLTLASSITGGADSADVSATGVGQPAIAYHFNAWLESVDGDVVPKQVPLLVTTLTDSVLTMDGASERIVLFGSDAIANTYLAFGESPAGETPWHLMLLLTQDIGSDARFIVNTFLGDSIDVTIPYAQ
jgi:hypothetical protein